MVKRIIGGIIAIITVSLLAILGPTSPSAYSATPHLVSAPAAAVAAKVKPGRLTAQYDTPWACINYRDITTCESVYWSKQTDGNGVRLEGWQVWTSNGCGSLEDSGGRYNEVNPFWTTPSQAMDTQWSFGAEDCNWTKDFYNNGKDLGAMEFHGVLKARINFATDKHVDTGWTVYPGGGWDLNYKIAYDVS